METWNEHKFVRVFYEQANSHTFTTDVGLFRKYTAQLTKQ